MRVVLVKPVISEKGVEDAKEKVYTFLVHSWASKQEVKEAVQTAFGVTVKSVRTSRVKGKTKRTQKRKEFSTPDFKKARVTVGEKDKIDLFETEEKKKKGKK